MILPVGSTAPRRHAAWATYAIIAVSTAVFLWQQSLTDREAVRFLIDYALIPRRYSDPQWAVWHGLDPNNRLPFLSMALLHGGWLHLILNMWTLWLFGRAVESRVGWPRFVLMYLLVDLAAAWAQARVYPDSMAPVIGASGAVAGVLGAHLALFARSRVVVLILVIVLPLLFRLPTVWFGLAWFGFQLFMGTTALMQPAGGVNVAWWAHIGGCVAGLIAAPLLAPPGRAPPAPPPAGAPPAAPPSGPWRQ